MPWFRIDDSFYDHPKVFDAPDCAVALWVRAGTWSSRNLTDGFVPAGMPARLCDDHDTAVRELVRRGLWKRANGGYQFHDWPDYQPIAQEVRALRSKRADAGRLGGLAKAANRVTQPKQSDLPVDNDSGQRQSGLEVETFDEFPQVEPHEPGKQNGSNPLASASQIAKQNAAPARPVPTPKGGSALRKTHDRVRAGPEPPQKCTKHANTAEPPPCGACADARRANQQWHADQRKRLAETPQCPHHRGQPATNCAPCRADQLAGADDP